MAEKYLRRMPQGPIILHQVMDAMRSLCAKSTCRSFVVLDGIDYGPNK